jgi:hypothetical protein
MAEDQDFPERVARIEALTRTLDRTSDPAVRAAVRELLKCTMDLHGSAINRMLEVVHESGPQGADIIDFLGQDPLIGSVLILHGLHPVDTAGRVAQAMEQLAPTFRKHGVEVELTRVEGSVVHLRIGTVPSASSGRVLKSSIEEQIYALAPDVTRVEGLNALGASDLVGIEAMPAGASYRESVAAGKGRN